MVVATKRAVGSQYEYRMPAGRAMEKNKARVRVRRSVSPLAGVVCGVFLVALLFSMGLSFTYLKACKAKLFFEITQLQQVNKSIEMYNEKLKLEAAKLKSLDRIETIAATQMGMTQNAAVQYLVLQGKEADNPQPAVRLTADATQETVAKTSIGKKLLEGIVAMIKERGPDIRG